VLLRHEVHLRVNFSETGHRKAFGTGRRSALSGGFEVQGSGRTGRTKS